VTKNPYVLASRLKKLDRVIAQAKQEREEILQHIESERLAAEVLDAMRVVK